MAALSAQSGFTVAFLVLFQYYSVLIIFLRFLTFFQMTNKTPETTPADVDKCFVKWRGSPHQHREDDIMIAPGSVDAVREAILFATRLETNPESGFDGAEFELGEPLAEGEGVWDLVAGKRLLNDTNHVALKLGQAVTNGTVGPKIVVNPDHKGEPTFVTADRPTVETTCEPRSAEALAEKVVNRMDGVLDYGSLKQEIYTDEHPEDTFQTFPMLLTIDLLSDIVINTKKRDLNKPLFALPLEDFPEFLDIGRTSLNSRAHFVEEFCAHLSYKLATISRLRPDYFTEYKRTDFEISGDQIKFFTVPRNTFRSEYVCDHPGIDPYAI